MKHGIFGFVLGAGFAIISGYHFATWQFWAFIVPVIGLHFWTVE